MPISSGSPGSPFGRRRCRLLLSVVPAIFVARALSRHPSFPGRAIILRLFALPLALPAIVAALGILALLGRAGYLAMPLSALSGGTWPGIYGLSGILVAHVFFNLPLATRFFLEALDTLPADQWRLASQLGMGPAASFRLIEWPAMRAALPGVRRPGLHALHHLLHHRAHARRRAGRDHARGRDLPGAAFRFRPGAGGHLHAASDRADGHRHVRADAARRQCRDRRQPAGVRTRKFVAIRPAGDRLQRRADRPGADLRRRADRRHGDIAGWRPISLGLPGMPPFSRRR